MQVTFLHYDIASFDSNVYLGEEGPLLGEARVNVDSLAIVIHPTMDKTPSGFGP